jgi:hypothetical protein
MPITLTDAEASVALHWWAVVQTMGGRGSPDERLAVRLQDSLPKPLPPRADTVPTQPKAPPDAPRLPPSRRRNA